MAASNRYSIYTSSLVYAGPTTLNMTQINQWSINPGSNKDRFIAGGNVDPSAAINVHSMPTVEFQTHDLTTVLPVVTISNGLSCTGGATFRLQQRTSGGTFSGGANNVTYSSTVGFAHPTRIEASQDDVNGAVMSCTYYPLWDGSTDPLVKNTGVTFSAIAPAFTSKFYLGPVYINAVEMNGVRRVSVDTGIRFDAFKASGDVYCRRGSIVERLPVISFDVLAAEETAYTSMFNAALAGTIAVYFRKGTDGGSRVVDATAQHTKISATTGAGSPDNISVQGTDDGLVRISVQTTSVLSATVASAIP